MNSRVYIFVNKLTDSLSSYIVDEETYEFSFWEGKFDSCFRIKGVRIVLRQRKYIRC